MLSLQQSGMFSDVKNPPKEWGDLMATGMSTVMMVSSQILRIWTGFNMDWIHDRSHGGVKQKSQGRLGLQKYLHCSISLFKKQNQIWKNGSPLFNQSGRSMSVFIIVCPHWNV